MLHYETIHPDTLELLIKIQLSSSKMMRFLIVNGVKVDIVNYPYPWIDAPIVEDGIVLAGVHDIAAMKLSAITNRGTYSLESLMDLYVEKYTSAQLFTTIKSLTYFEDAELDPMPRMAESLDWNEVKKSITEAVTGLD